MKEIPILTKTIGGETDTLIEIKYSTYFPKEIYKFETGLRIYESIFRNTDGNRCTLGGPHKEFLNMENKSRGLHVSKYVYPLVNAYRDRFSLENEVPLLGAKI